MTISGETINFRDQDLDEILTDLTKKKIFWIMEILEMNTDINDCKTRIKKAIWVLKDEIQEKLVKEILELIEDVEAAN